MDDLKVGDYCYFYNDQYKCLYYHKIIELNSPINGQVVAYSFLFQEVRHIVDYPSSGLVKIKNPRLLNLLGVVYDG